MYKITPITITDAILTGTNVPDSTVEEWVGGTGVFAALSQTTRNWRGMCAAPNGDIYACVFNGDIYKQTGGVGDFVALSQTSRAWVSLCAASDGDIYACVYGGDIYKQTGGSGNFAALSQTSRSWTGLCADLDGDIYACVDGGDIYKQTGGSGNFAALSQTSRAWTCLCTAPNGDIYAGVWLGDIYKQTSGSGNFTALSQTSRNWNGLCADLDGNIYACDYGGDIYKRIGGVGNFTALGQTLRSWFDLCADLNGNIYASVFVGDIYKRVYVPIYSQEEQVVKNHVIYESLTNNNENNDPEDDDQDAPVNWLFIEHVNRWRAFNNKFGNRTEQATKIEYVLTPGQSFDSASLLDLDSDTVDLVLIDSADALLNETAWTGASGTTQSTGWNKVGSPSAFLIDGGMIKITADAASEGQSKTVAVTPGVEYQLLGLYKNTAGDIAQYGVYDNIHAANIKATTDLASSTANASFSDVFTAPAGCTSVEIKLMAKTSGDIVWFDSVILAPTEYSETVTTGSSKTDVVKLDIPEIVTGILTVTINKSGTAAIGELIIGNQLYMGEIQEGAQNGIEDYSTLDQDSWGNWDITEKGYSKKMTCTLLFDTTLFDTIYKSLSDDRAKFRVWVGSETYSAMIIYGKYDSFNMVWGLEQSSCAITIIGLTSGE